MRFHPSACTMRAVSCVLCGMCLQPAARSSNGGPRTSATAVHELVHAPCHRTCMHVHTRAEGGLRICGCACIARRAAGHRAWCAAARCLACVPACVLPCLCLLCDLKKAHCVPSSSHTWRCWVQWRERRAVFRAFKAGPRPSPVTMAHERVCMHAC